jgi:uncharacterized protein YjcR
MPFKGKVADDNRFIMLYNKGLSAIEIANEMGCTASTIAYWRKRLKLPPCKNGKVVKFDINLISEIKEKIKNETYKIDADHIADCLISSLKNVVYEEIDHGKITRDY